MSSLMHCFAAIAGSITKMNITGPPLMDILFKYTFELRRTCPNFWWKKVLPAYRHFNTNNLRTYLCLNSLLVNPPEMVYTVLVPATDISEPP